MFPRLGRYVGLVCALGLVAMFGAANASVEQPGSGAKYSLKRVALPASSGASIRVGAVEVAIDGPENEQPRVWEGPLKFKSKPDGAWCEVDASLVTKVFLDEKRRLAVVLSYSGSTTYVDFVEVDTCGAKWPRIEAATMGVEVSASSVKILPGCDGPASQSRCNAGRVFGLRAGHAPELLKKDSRALTRSVLKVDFEGEAWVAYPGGAKARLLSP